MAASESVSPADLTPAQANITAYWHGHAPAYDAHPMSQLHMGAAKEAWARVWRAALPAAPADVLDVGTGTGFLSILLAEMGYRVTGLDASEGILDAARRKSAHAPAVPPASFDAVTSRHLLWTLRDPAGAFAAWREALRRGGLVVAIDSLWFMEEGSGGTSRSDAPYADAWRTHWDELVSAGMPLLRAQSLESVADMFTSAGFTDVRVARLAAVERLDEQLAEDTERRPLPRYAVIGRRGAE